VEATGSLTYFQEEVPEKLGLDKYCYKIMLLMFVKTVYEDHPMRFNELYNLVYSAKVRWRGMSKPTFNDHLQHLVKRGYVKRQRKGKQNVIYFLNDKFPEIEEAKETSEGILHTQQMISKKSRSFSLDDMVKFVVDFATLIELSQAYTLIEDALQPEKRFDHTIAFSLQHAYLQSFFVRFYEISLKDKKAALNFKAILENAINLKSNELSKLTGVQLSEQARK